MMDEAIFEQKLNELVSEIGSMPDSQQKKLMLLAKKTRETHNQLKKSVTHLQESLDYLRVSIKYLLFDLEATRRENTYLKKLLEDNNSK
ncbi:MAG TPA: hypothetical protein P5279_12090 [Anaerohalosphaeraceae bacterium]|jgi:uncharacterized coiled-coil protein SlyX|nr:hypothetical protein [Anaerohalosphaeraceae bacterium]HRT51230.1 hypothetical protein [Anaerohalosphaeraceae bacterium]HRT87421.1 hypothetical protein [Anaerohalosphaeraceae bacterium]